MKLNFSDSEPVLNSEHTLEKLAQSYLELRSASHAELAPEIGKAFRQGYFVGFKDGFNAARSNLISRENLEPLSKPLFTFQNSPNVLSKADDVDCHSLEDNLLSNQKSRRLDIKLTQFSQEPDKEEKQKEAVGLPNQRKKSLNFNKSMNMGKGGHIQLSESRAYSLDMGEDKKARDNDQKDDEKFFEDISQVSDYLSPRGFNGFPFNLNQLEKASLKDNIDNRVF